MTSAAFFNFSLKKVLVQEPDSLKRARLKIVFVTLVLSILKVVILLPIVFGNIPDNQLYRLYFVFALYLLLTKYLLSRPDNINVVSHIIISTGVLAVWSNLFFFGQQLNLITIQFMFMVSFVGYYLINSRFAVIYSLVAIFPVMVYLLTNKAWHLGKTTQELPSPAFEITVLMNFSTMVIIHYMFYKAFRDNVNEKEKLNKQLHQNIAETKALADSRSVFLSTMSHELRTPLNAVIGMTSLIRDTATKEQGENLDILEFSATSLLTLVNDILDYNKSENDKIALEPIPVHLPVLLHKVCTGLQQKANEKGIKLLLEVDDHLNDKWVITDPTRLTQIIYNLVGNAIKFTEYGHVSIKATAVSLDEEQIIIDFSVSDTGIGIPDDRQQLIFEPFVQASADTTRRYGGTGLGLAIVKRLLGLFNSEIKLESKQNEGSVFSFDVKFELYTGSIAAIPLSSGIHNSLAGLNVLIAEDNPINALLLVKLLSKWNINTIVTKNGQEAIDAHLAGSFDVVLMDLHMPVKDGYQAAIYIRALNDGCKATIPLIALTASVSHNIYDKIKQAGMDDYLSKPFQSVALYQKLERVYAGKKSQPLQNAT
ncbi:ATP-binding protein [Mucilaginibacter segetis]|uniref:histidine kinase n=1 Tax=Mucilaginibacter segetis TaxID=2793071 RepID=A0A934PY91_9SPHI|nr:ATP-binding protein [Mucilaginibacter segetis]MBK0381266.1 response regulator [Mucilaginibacter segetis]